MSTSMGHHRDYRRVRISKSLEKFYAGRTGHHWDYRRVRISRFLDKFYAGRPWDIIGIMNGSGFLGLSTNLTQDVHGTSLGLSMV